MKDERLEQFIQDFSMTISSHLSSNEHKKLMRLGNGEARIMMYVSNHSNEDITPGTLSEMLNVGTGRIANALKDLESKGLIVREVSQADKRKIIVKVTEKGKEMDKIAKKEFRDRITHIYECLGEEDAKEFLRLLKKMTNSSRKE